MRRILTALIALLLLASCSPKHGGTPPPTDEPVFPFTPSPSATVTPGRREEATPTRAPTEAVSAELIPLDLNSSADYKGLPLAIYDNGAPTVTAVDGVIGVVCVGMSNGFLECGDFLKKWDEGKFGRKIGLQVRFVNCAVGGRAIEYWNNPELDHRLWDACIQRKIPETGLRPDQIRVIWHKAADMFPFDEGGALLPPYPDPRSDYFRFYDNLSTFAARVKDKFPSVQAVYVSSRSYGGFASVPERGEPLSYEEGLALNQWLKDHPTVDGIWFGWGPYIWAPDCSSGQTNASGVCYVRGDFQEDGVHPAQGALDKISWMMHAWFSRFEWYRP
jgi:hypothetical protein